jgi:biotin transport system substrate-specific component
MALPLPGSPVPLVLQNFIAVLSGLLLGPVRGGAAVLLFLLLGAAGFPVFSGGHGGIAWFAGPTGGYLVGYLPAALLAGLGGRDRRPISSFLAAFLGFAAILACGVIRLKFLKNVDWPKALAIGLLPFIIGDSLKAILAAFLSIRLGPFIDRLSGREAGKD